MRNRMEFKLAIVAILVAAAFFSRTGQHLFTLGVLVFGVINVFLELPGTDGARAAGVIATFVTFFWPCTLLLLLLVMAWPPAFAVAWALAERPPATRAEEEAQESATRRARILVTAVIVAVAVASIAYHLIVSRGLQQTAVLFIGIPTILAIMVVFMISPRSAIGVAAKTVTVGLLVSMTVLGEGMLCVAMSAPLFYAVAIVVATAMNGIHRSRGEKATLHSMAVLLAVIPMTLEGVTSALSFDREETVSVTKLIAASPQAVQRALFVPPRFDRARPFCLRAGFPTPIATDILRSSGDTRWVIRLRGGEMRLNGMEPRAGDLTLALDDSQPGLVRWHAVSDTSHVTHFLTWRAMLVEWHAVGDQTLVTWTLRYRRDLDPAWYFGPMERYAAQLAAGYLIDTVATP